MEIESRIFSVARVVRFQAIATPFALDRPIVVDIDRRRLTKGLEVCFTTFFFFRV